MHLLLFRSRQVGFWDRLLVIKDLDEFIANDLQPLDQVAEKNNKPIVEMAAAFLKNIRLEQNLSHVELANIFLASKKIKNSKSSFLLKKNFFKVVRLFESGDYCPPYDFLYDIAEIFSKESELEILLDSINKEFPPPNEGQDHSYIVCLLNVFYEKKKEYIESIINPINQNVLEFDQYKKS